MQKWQTINSNDNNSTSNSRKGNNRSISSWATKSNNVWKDDKAFEKSLLEPNLELTNDGKLHRLKKGQDNEEKLKKKMTQIRHNRNYIIYRSR